MPSAAQYSTNLAASGGGSDRRRQAVGLSLKIWSAVAPICRARRPARSSPPATPRWIPIRGEPGGQVSRRRGSARDTVRGMDDEREAVPGSPASLDLLTVALAVFFIALIALVAALLILPTLGG